MASGQGGVVRGPVWRSGPGWVPMATGILLRGIKPSSRRSIITAACCLLAWATGIAVALQLVKFPTIAMSAFFLVGLAAAALLGLLAERLARFLEATDVIARSTRLQATAFLTLFALAAPILGSRYVPGIRLSPLPDPPGHPTIAFSASGCDGNPEIYLMRGSARDLSRLTFDPAYDLWPARSPDGTKIAFTSVRAGNADIWKLDVNGGDLSNLTARSLADDSEPSWSPDGTAIAFARSRRGVGTIWIVPAPGGHPSLLTPRDR